MSNNITQINYDANSIETKQASDALDELSVEIQKINLPEEFCKKFDVVLKLLDNSIKLLEVFYKKVPISVIKKTITTLNDIKNLLAILNTGFCPTQP
ncbi:TPA: hypothetical protein ACNUZQ_000687 [Citrobacter braakii]|uniref:Uncharacterized protein n=1 Tax=Citrobacter murliniae TaxID=67829 RepID=A0ABY2PQ16_9ENTR|nr:MULTISPECIES: hypothetical protein [Citrobacter freundii complex]KLV67217.1 hypothetical protein SK36_01939 [Citrobacter sp. MGH106]MBJ9872328.1 hypothetical protein [Citrobacter werkmanii]THE34874.1 hypothetical protein DJ535_20465 [Citrobacter murliniae]HEB0854419.1 hypothetical protein [Citrobacter freundii]